MDIKKYIKVFIPPIIINIYQKKLNPYGFFYGYTSWLKAKNDSIGYNDVNILNKVKNSLLRVKKGEAAYERDSVLFNKIEYSWPLLAILLKISLDNDNQLNLIDFGGSLGSTYFQNINFIKNLKNISWNIVEQKNFVDCGIKYLSDDNLKFYESIENCLQENKISTILFGSSLQYIEDPQKLLTSIFKKNIKYIIIDRLPINNKKDIITVQKIDPIIYNASYPAWILNENNLIKLFEQNNYQLVVDFDALGGKFNIKKSSLTGLYKSYFFELQNL